MNPVETMSAAARRAMIEVLDLAPRDRVLVVTDQATRDCGDAFARGAEQHGCPVNLFLLPEDRRPLQQVPDGLLPALGDADVVINAMIGDAREVPFRLQWIAAIEDCGRVRLGHSPGIDAEMMTGGALDVDYAGMRRQADRLITAFDGARSLRITSAAGTDLTLDVSDRPFVHDLKVSVKAGCNLPCGEVYCCPVETGADGVLVIDGCFGSYGNVASPLRFTLAAGRVTAVAGDDAAALAVVTELLDTDAGARTIAELGIGLNPGARLTPRMLEAEKAHRTAHIAFGSNQGMPGGRSRSATHIDYLFREPTIEAIDRAGVARVILEAGALP